MIKFSVTYYYTLNYTAHFVAHLTDSFIQNKKFAESWKTECDGWNGITEVSDSWLQMTVDLY